MKFVAVWLLAAAVTLQCAAQQEASKKKWALLVAGSSGWDNYAHQANMCHAWHSLRRHGIPAENIILMMYDDVANDPANPWPGILINRLNGSDVYKGVPIDYRGETITPANFLKILSGDKKAMHGIGTGRVIESTKNDDVFVYFNDHGDVGELCFPEDVLTVKDLTATLVKMYKKKSYNRMALYVESCYSGSMFDGQLQEKYNIFAETASKPDESAYFCQWDNTLQTLINTEYSYNWMVDIDDAKVGKETVEQEFLRVRKLTELSTVMQYGTKKLESLKLSEFFGAKEAHPIPYPHRAPCNSTWPPSAKQHRPATNDAALFLLHARLAKATGREAKALKDQIDVVTAKRQYVDAVSRGIIATLTKNEVEAKQVLETKHSGPIRNVDCHDALIKTFHKSCFNLGKHPYALKYSGALANVCDLYADDYYNAVQGIRKVCKQLIGSGVV